MTEEKERGEVDEVVLSYASTVHKNQGTELPIAISPIATEHPIMLRSEHAILAGKKLVVLVHQSKALAMAGRGKLTIKRLTGQKA